MIITPKQRYLRFYFGKIFLFFLSTGVLNACWAEGQESILICFSVPIFYWTLHRRVNTACLMSAPSSLTALWEPRRTSPASSPWGPGGLPDDLEDPPRCSHGALVHYGWSQASLEASWSQETSLHDVRQLQNRRFRVLRCPPGSHGLWRPRIGPTWCGDHSRGWSYYRYSFFTKRVHPYLHSGAAESNISENEKMRVDVRRCRYLLGDADNCSFHHHLSILTLVEISSHYTHF